MSGTDGVRPGREMVRAVLFVIGTLAGLFVVYVLAINLSAAARGESGDWTQALFAVVPATLIGVAALVLRSRLR